MPKSCLSAPLPKRRKTTKTSASARAILPDELESYQTKQLVKFNEIAQNIQFEDVVSYEMDDEVIIQSKKLVFGIPHYLIKIKRDLIF